ncbi:MAG: hypothetical protein HZB38_13300 [Planctomycetes bacterium]|nr:hypothetical protein [Planctomycetota bacterium]
MGKTAETSIPEQASVERVLSAFRNVRAAVSELLQTVGTDANQTRETARLLGLNRGLAWRVTRLVRSKESPTLVSDVPGRQSLEQLLAACRKRGAPDSILQEVRRAFESYEAAVGSCSGDRKTLAMMMANHDTVGASNGFERARRSLFDGACGVWGVQAQVRFVTVFVFPSRKDPKMLDAGHITGFVGLRRLFNRPWPVCYEAVHKQTGEAAIFEKLPLGGTGETEGELQLLPGFCDPPKPPIVVSQDGSFKRFELAAGPVGNQGLTTVVFGSYLSRLYPRYSETPDTAGFMVLMQTPVERLIFDIFVHRDLAIPAPPAVQLLDRLTYTHTSDESQFPRQALPISETPHVLPRGAAGALTVHVPFYLKLLAFASERIGCSIDQFDGSRFEMAYPPVSTTLSRRFDLYPER